MLLYTLHTVHTRVFRYYNSHSAPENILSTPPTNKHYNTAATSLTVLQGTVQGGLSSTRTAPSSSLFHGYGTAIRHIIGITSFREIIALPLSLRLYRSLHTLTFAVIEQGEKRERETTDGTTHLSLLRHRLPTLTDTQHSDKPRKSLDTHNRYPQDPPHTPRTLPPIQKSQVPAHPLYKSRYLLCPWITQDRLYKANHQPYRPHLLQPLYPLPARDKLNNTNRTKNPTPDYSTYIAL